MFNRSEISERLRINPTACGDMDKAVELWAACYKNASPWCRDGVHSLNLPYTVSHELAKLVTLELESVIDGSARADYLAGTYAKTIEDSPVWVEYACALGGVFLKPYITAKGICTDYVQADAAFPTAYDGSGCITGCIFTERIFRGGSFYTRLEHHSSLEDGTYLVENRAFRSDRETLPGREIPLSSVSEWAELLPSVTLRLSRPLFAYMRIPGANIIDRRSPLGTSVFSAALPAIEDADRQYSRLLWEFEGSELAVYVDETAIGKNSNGKEFVPKLNKRLIKTLDFGEDGRFETFSPAIRDSSQINGLNQLLRNVERQCGLAFGTISDVTESTRTATEVKLSRQRSYATVSAIQRSVKHALTDYAQVLDELCTLYALAPEGKINQSFSFDDSLVTDSETEQEKWLREVEAGLMSPVEYRMKRYGETKEQAEEAINF